MTNSLFSQQGVFLLQTHSTLYEMSVPPHDLSQTIPPQTLRRFAQEWLLEDTPNFDLAGVCVGSRVVKARLLCKTPGTVLAGRPFFDAVFTELGCTVEWAHREGQKLGGCNNTSKLCYVFIQFGCFFACSPQSGT